MDLRVINGNCIGFNVNYNGCLLVFDALYWWDVI